MLWQAVIGDGVLYVLRVEILGCFLSERGGGVIECATGHIARRDQEKKIFTDVTQEAAASATADIQKREGELADEFKKKGLAVIAVDKTSFKDAIMKNVTFESMGYSKADWEKIQAIK